MIYSAENHHIHAYTREKTKAPSVAAIADSRGRSVSLSPYFGVAFVIIALYFVYRSFYNMKSE